jgi:predicted nucleotidyltransferase
MRERGTEQQRAGRAKRQRSGVVGVPLLDDDPILAEMVRRLVAELQPERIYLFGSRARGEPHEDSDYDFLIVVRERNDQPERMEVRARAALWGVDASVDIVVMTAAYYDWMLGAAASLPATVEREGRVLYAA